MKPLVPRRRHLERLRIHGEVDRAFIEFDHMVIQRPKSALLRKEVAVQEPEHEGREVRDSEVEILRLPRSEREHRGDQGHRPTLEQEEVRSHPVDGLLDELEVLQLLFHSHLRCYAIRRLCPVETRPPRKASCWRQAKRRSKPVCEAINSSWA